MFTWDEDAEATTLASPPVWIWAMAGLIRRLSVTNSGALRRWSHVVTADVDDEC
jgi:hypothetical protein